VSRPSIRRTVCPASAVLVAQMLMIRLHVQAGVFYRACLKYRVTHSAASSHIRPAGRTVGETFCRDSLDISMEFRAMNWDLIWRGQSQAHSAPLDAQHRDRDTRPDADRFS
jgi:hypothetical protein